MSDNPILCVFFWSSLFFDGDTIVYKEAQERNTKGLSGQKHFFKTASKTFPFTAILKPATRSYVRPSLQKKENPCNLEPRLLCQHQQKIVSLRNPPVPDMAVLFSASGAFLTLQHHKSMEPFLFIRFSSSVAKSTTQS